MPIVPETFTAPDSWASYFINGDSSGMEAAEIAQADAWAATLPGPIVGLEEGESSFTWHHDAQAILGPIGATVAAYIVHREATPEEAATWAAGVALEAARAEERAAEEAEDKARDSLEEAEEAEAHAQARASAAREALEEARAAREALGRGDPSGLVMDAQARLEAARKALEEAQEAAEEPEEVAHARREALDSAWAARLVREARP